MWLSTWGTPTIPHQHLLLYHHYNYTHEKIAIDGDSIPHGCHRRQYDFIYSPQYVLNCLSGKLLYGKPRCRAYLVNSERVAEIKVGNPVGWGSTQFGSGFCSAMVILLLMWSASLIETGSALYSIFYRER
jgi:hypothetical protein